MSPSKENLARFTTEAAKVGAKTHHLQDISQLAEYIAQECGGPLIFDSSPSLERTQLLAALAKSGVEVLSEDLRCHGARAEAGLTGANFGIAATGTVVLESTSEAVRIATTLPEKHFVVMDPRKILRDSQAALPVIRQFHEQHPQLYLAYLTGPSRTADIERVLTIGVHGPRELHILFLDELSGDPLER